MSDLISREEALAYPLSYDHYDKKNGDIKFIHGVESYRDYIEGLPTVEQKHGHWKYDDECECFVCSSCEMSALNNWRCKSTNSKYCPNCGAKMDEKCEVENVTNNT